jgi:hypothetical protein
MVMKFNYTGQDDLSTAVMTNTLRRKRKSIPTIKDHDEGDMLSQRHNIHKYVKKTISDTKKQLPETEYPYDDRISEAVRKTTIFRKKKSSKKSTKKANGCGCK